MMKKLTASLFLAALMALPLISWAGESYYIDVRTQEEFDAGHVSIAALIPYDEIAERIAEVTEDPEAEIFLYCRSGNRAGKAQKVLQDMGYQRVENLGSLEEARVHASQNADSSLIFD